MQYIFLTDGQVMMHWICFCKKLAQAELSCFPGNFEFLLVHLIVEPVIMHVNRFSPFDLQSVMPTAHSLLQKDSVSDYGYPRSVNV